MAAFFFWVKPPDSHVASRTEGRYANTSQSLRTGNRMVTVKRPAGNTHSKAKRRDSSHRISTWLRLMAIVLAIIAMAPLALTAVYTFRPVRPVSTLMLTDIVALRGYDRQWVPLTEIAPVLLASVTMSEDGRFCSHFGIDFGALNEVLDGALDGEPLRGASTITMQTVKNLFLWHGRSFLRKLLEAPLALMFDAIVPKKRIMEIYLNIAEWGPGIYGVQAASQHYFKKPASELNARQAALLAVTLPGPLARDPANPSKNLNTLAAIIEKRARNASSHIACLQ